MYMVTVLYSVVEYDYCAFVWIFFLANVMKGRATLLLCIVYFAPPI